VRKDKYAFWFGEKKTATTRRMERTTIPAMLKRKERNTTHAMMKRRKGPLSALMRRK
jgi:hypothetical protein